jgi:coiled-coil domain-containing protein 61
VVSLTKTDTGETWEGQFDEDFVENLTKKTGNAKSFKVFCKMLYSALDQSSDSVMLDVLTPRDLELLRERKTKEIVNHRGTPTNAQGSFPFTKRIPI